MGVKGVLFRADLPKKEQSIFFEGKDIHVDVRQPGRAQSFGTTYEGAIHWAKHQYAEAASDRAPEGLEGYMRRVPCAGCGGGRLTQSQLAVTLGGKNIAETSALPVASCAEFVSHLKLTAGERIVAEPILNEMLKRLDSIREVGLDYLSLD